MTGTVRQLAVLSALVIQSGCSRRDLLAPQASQLFETKYNEHRGNCLKL